MSSTLICSHRSTSMVVECQIRITLMDAPTNGKAKRRECRILLQSSLLISSHNISSPVAPPYQTSTIQCVGIFVAAAWAASRRPRPSRSDGLSPSLLESFALCLICPLFPFRNHDVDPTPDGATRRRRRAPLVGPCSLARSPISPCQ